MCRRDSGAGGPEGEVSDRGGANGEDSDGGDLAGHGDRGFRGGDASAPAGVEGGPGPVSGDMSGLISRARGLGGEAPARQEGPVWRKGSFQEAAGASLQEAAPSADEQARPRGTSAGSS